MHCFVHDDEPRCASFAPSSPVLATAAADGTLSLFDLDSGELVETCRAHTEAINHAVFSPDGGKIATASADKTAKVLQVQTLECELTISGHKGQVLCAKFSPDGRQLATASRELTCRIFEVPTGTQVCAIMQRSRVLSCAFAPSGTALATCAMDGVRLFDASSGDKILDIASDASTVNRPVTCCAFNASGDLLATGGDNGVAIFNFKLERQVAHSKRHRETVHSVAFSPHGKSVATASADRTVSILSLNESSGRTGGLLQGLHCILHLPDKDAGSQSHGALSTTSEMYQQLRSLSYEGSTLGRQSCALPFSEEDVKQVVIGARHIAILLTDGRVCRMSFTLNPSAVLEQVERAQTKAAPGLGARGRLGGAARNRAAHGIYSRRPQERNDPPPRRSAGSSSRQARTEQRQLNAEVFENQQQRERERLGLAGRSGRGGGSGGAGARPRGSLSLQGSAGRAQHSTFAYHPAIGLDAAAASLEMRASAGLGIPRRAVPASPPEAMIQVVQDMFGSVPRDVIVRDLRATGSIEATIDHLLTRNSGGSDSESSATSPSPGFDGGVLAALSRPGAGSQSSRSAPLRSAPARSAPRASASAASFLSASSGLAAAATEGASTFNVAELQWWGGTDRFTCIGAMVSDLVAVRSDGKLCCWPWERETGSAEHPKSAELKLHGEAIKLLSTCDTHGVVVTESGLVASWLDSCFSCAAVAALSGCSVAQINQAATMMAAFESDPVALLDTSNFLTTAVTSSGKVFWWGLKSFAQRKKQSEVPAEPKRPATAGPIEVGTQVILRNAAQHKAGSLACSISGAPTLFELERKISTANDTTEYDFKVLPWPTDEQDGETASSTKCRLSEVLFLGVTEADDVGEVLKVDGNVAAVLFSSSDSAQGGFADALQRCRLVNTSELRRASESSNTVAKRAAIGSFVESVPQRVQLAGVGPCLPFSCAIADYKLSLLLKRPSDGSTFSYVADIANQQYSARQIRVAADSMWPANGTAVPQLVSGSSSDCSLIRDVNGAAFPPRGLPAIRATSIGQRQMPCLGQGRLQPLSCNLVAVVFSHAKLHEGLCQGDLDAVKDQTQGGGAENAVFEGNQNVFHVCATASAGSKGIEVLEFLLSSDAVKSGIERLLTARDEHGRTPFVSSVWADNLAAAELLLEKIDGLEPRDARRWAQSDEGLHARAVLAADITGRTSLHYLCAAASEDDTRVHLRTMCADAAGPSSTKMKITKLLLEATDIGGAQDHSARTAFAAMLVSRVAPSVDVALELASNWHVVKHTVEGSTHSPVAASQLDQLMFRVLSGLGDDDEKIATAFARTAYAGGVASTPEQSSVAQRFVQSVVRVFSAVCATGTVRSEDTGPVQPTYTQVKTSCRRMFCMMPVLAIEALVQSADALITPVRLGMVAPVAGLETEQTDQLSHYTISRDVFGHASPRATSDLTGDLLDVLPQSSDAAEVAGQVDAESDADVEDVLSVMDFGDDDEEADRSLVDEEEDEDDHDEHDEDEDMEDPESRHPSIAIDASMEDEFIMGEARHAEAVIDVLSDEDDALGAASLASGGLREKEKAAAMDQQTAASLYGCAFSRIVKELVELFQELIPGDGSMSERDDVEEIRDAARAACTRLERTWQWLFVVMDCTESQLRANSSAPQPKPSLPTGAARKSAAGFQTALLGVLRAQSTDAAPVFSHINICQYRAVAYITDTFVYFASQPMARVSQTTAPPLPSINGARGASQLESFFLRTPSTTPHGAASPVTFRASMKRGLPLAERPHLLTPRATKRSMFGDVDGSESSTEDSEGDSRPRKKAKREPAGHVNFSAFLDASTHESATGRAEGGGGPLAPPGKSLAHCYTPSEILERWESSFRQLADAFLEDVGQEPHSCLSHMAGFPIKQKIFRKKAAAVCAESSLTIKIEVSRSSLLGDLFAALDREYDRRRRQAIPLVCRNLLAQFKGEQGEGDGVTRGLLAAASSKLASGESFPPPRGAVGENTAPLFHAPGKDGFFTPMPLDDYSTFRLGCFTNVGRILGLSILHNLPISLAFTRPTIKFILGRNVNWTDLAFHSPDLYESFRKLLISAASGSDFAEAGGADLTFEVTEPKPGGGWQPVELRPGGAQQPVTCANVKSYVMLYAAHRMVETVRRPLEAIRSGLAQVVPEKLLAGLTAEDFVLLLNGCGPRVEVRWLKGITTFKDSRAEQSRASGRPLPLFEKLYWAAVSR